VWCLAVIIALANLPAVPSAFQDIVSDWRGPAFISGLSLAFIGNASGQTCGAERISIRGVFDNETRRNRWLLRRMRCAMGFQRQSVAESSTVRTLVNSNGGVVIVESVGEPAEECADRGEEACWRGAGTRMHTAGDPHP
jgi:hypothetical protein